MFMTRDTTRWEKSFYVYMATNVKEAKLEAKMYVLSRVVRIRLSGTDGNGFVLHVPQLAAGDGPSAFDDEQASAEETVTAADDGVADETEDPTAVARVEDVEKIVRAARRFPRSDPPSEVELHVVLNMLNAQLLPILEQQTLAALLSHCYLDIHDMETLVHVCLSRAAHRPPNVSTAPVDLFQDMLRALANTEATSTSPSTAPEQNSAEAQLIVKTRDPIVEALAWPQDLDVGHRPWAAHEVVDNFHKLIDANGMKTGMMVFEGKEQIAGGWSCQLILDSVGMDEVYTSGVSAKAAKVTAMHEGIVRLLHAASSLPTTTGFMAQLQVRKLQGAHCTAATSTPMTLSVCIDCRYGSSHTVAQ